MAELGRILVDRVGVIREVDDAFCATMKSAADRLIGRNVLELTAAPLVWRENLGLRGLKALPLSYGAGS